jgi:endonuclease/exonuclease/phosphatase family metal-dependent hydrolase
MIKIIASTILIINLFSSFGCQVESVLEEIKNVHTNDIRISQYGSEESFDIATWNIEHFPKDRSYTLPYLTRIIRNIDIDLIAIQEIDEMGLFLRLIDSLDAYQGYVSSLPGYGQRLGIIYKSDIISISDPKQLFIDDDWAFPRPPLVSFVTVKNENYTIFDFILIVLHLKAFVETESKSRRSEACEKLKYYIDTYLLSGAEKDIIILGDLNDELDDPPQENVFKVFLDDSLNYQFLTLPLAAEPTLIGEFESSIDHLLITDGVRDEYDEGFTQVLKIDEEFSSYCDIISDHRPVLTQFFIF